jgi:copper ion binding protein
MKQTVKIQGMMCMHCQKHVQAALSSLEGVKKVEVDLKSGTAVIEEKTAVPESAIRKAVADAGYQVTSVEEIR